MQVRKGYKRLLVEGDYDYLILKSSSPLALMLKENQSSKWKMVFEARGTEVFKRNDEIQGSIKS